MRYEIYKRRFRWRWRFVGGNNEIVASGQGYVSKAGARHACMLLRGSGEAPIVDTYAVRAWER